MDYGGLWWIVRAIERVDERVVKVDERVMKVEFHHTSGPAYSSSALKRSN